MMLATIASLQLVLVGLPLSVALLYLIGGQPEMALACIPFAGVGWLVSSRLIDLVFLSAGEHIRESNRPPAVPRPVERNLSSDDD